MGPREDRLPKFYEDDERPKYLGAYHTWLQYGGPEEGGWWVTMYKHIASVLVRPDDDLNQLAVQLWREYADEDDGCRISDTNASNAVVVLCEKQPASGEHLTVGHYE
jgi:hypothetical protein